MEPISKSSKVDSVILIETSLVGVKSFNLMNKADSLLDMNLYLVDMDRDLCTSLLKQIPSLTNLNFLRIMPWDHNRKNLQLQGNETFCRLPREICSQFLRSVSHLHHLVHLDLTGNNLSGCLKNFLSDSDSKLALLEALDLQNTTLSASDVNHLAHIMETRKLPNLADLGLSENNLFGMENEIEKLLNASITYHKQKLEVRFQYDRFPLNLFWKWEILCSGTNVQLLPH